MSTPSTDPDKYSIDDMMDRLKSRSDEAEGELVTRADGTQAIKRRKRRRRTEQPEKGLSKRHTRFQIVQIAAAVVLIAAVGLAAGIALLYANSSMFRDSLIGKLESASGAKVTLTQFRMNPATANSNSASLVWPSGNVLGTLELGGIAAKHSPKSFLGSVFTGEEIVAAKGTLDLKAADPAGEKRQVPATEGVAGVSFMRYSVPSLNVRFGAERGYWGALWDTEASLFPGITAGISEVRLKDGDLKLRDWPEMVLDRGYMKMSGAELQIQTLRFYTPLVEKKPRAERGLVNFSGSISPLKSSEPQTLVAELEAFPLKYLLGGDLGNFFHGDVETQESPDSNFLMLQPDSPEEARIQVSLANTVDSELNLSGFKFLNMLAAVLEDRWYELPVFDESISMVVNRQGRAVEISEVEAEKRGRMLIRGTLRNGGGGQLSGVLRVGLPDTTVAASRSERLDNMFGAVRENYRWIEVTISGTSALPQDDFREQFERASAGGGSSEKKEEKEMEPDSFDGLIEGE